MSKQIEMWLLTVMSGCAVVLFVADVADDRAVRSLLWLAVALFFAVLAVRAGRSAARRRRRT
ncbi:hypothetical protein LRP67_11635 [Nocardioides sp. cx-169]|uniref:hypothetical protein n=1 Tax=Nocardioides sp. cx-169 TaxID=2899080 RepID=UPI001E4993E5|nr:hypothetical protein [Nocardioides sp. cx-169]MCD4534735.1 hypothetical protein [Nocardioides sp. cx-169]